MLRALRHVEVCLDLLDPLLLLFRGLGRRPLEVGEEGALAVLLEPQELGTELVQLFLVLRCHRRHPVPLLLHKGFPLILERFQFLF